MTKVITIKNIKIGGGNKVAVQSMTNAPPDDIPAVIRQIKALERAGCDIVRIAVPDAAAAKSIAEIKKSVKAPVVADIHYDYRLAALSIENGADKIRINPGNLGGEDKLKYVADCAKAHGVPIRVGINGGSLEKDMSFEGKPFYIRLGLSALKNVSLLEKFSFYDIVVSVKASSVADTVAAYEFVSSRCDYPLHLGVTEAGSKKMAVVKSAAAMGSLLLKGIGDTIRVSITGNPVSEVEAAKDILRAVGKLPYAEVISCPTCGRCRYDMTPFLKAAEKYAKNAKKAVKIAVMGCSVNGPGEAMEADIGIAGGTKLALFKKGKVIKTLTPESALAEFTKELCTL
jgi:(E)-4-hydroxy-3-methylbut-2-enyl-diphosphate synthase